MVYGKSERLLSYWFNKNFSYCNKNIILGIDVKLYDHTNWDAPEIPHLSLSNEGQNVCYANVPKVHTLCIS